MESKKVVSPKLTVTFKKYKPGFFMFPNAAYIKKTSQTSQCNFSKINKEVTVPLICAKEFGLKLEILL